MCMQPKVSIILVNYNGYRDTIECLQSLRDITYPNYEVIVVDNASTDESAGEISSFTKDNEILIMSKENGGFSAGNNIGIKYALEHNTDYCLLLNNDTVVEPNFLDKLISGFAFSGNCGLTIGKILYESNRDTIWYAGGSISRKTAKTEHWHYREIDEGLQDNPQVVSFATGCCMCLSKETIEKVGLLDERYFLYEEDADYSYRIADAEFELLYIPEARIYHKVSASTGNSSKASQYYTIRNKYMFIKERFESKYSAYVFTTLQIVYRCIIRKNNFTIFLKAFKSFRKGESGKIIL